MADITLGSSASAVSARPELSIHDGTVTTTSAQVAQFFGKRHDNVLRAIRVLLREGASEDYLLNFEEVIMDFTNGKGGVQSGTAYRMTREGFMLLAMGFTGKEALRWKLAFIAAFNRMEAELQKPAYDPARIQLAHTLAAQAAAQVTQTVFEAIASGSNSDWRRARYMLSFAYDNSGQPSLPHVKTLADGQMVASMAELTQHIINHDVAPSDAQLAALATACTQQLTHRAQFRERKALAASASATPEAPVATPTTNRAVAAPLPPHIGSDGKPLPPGTFRAVFV
nr:Rha family transcriptional regulator [uncultured Comamonas sp.]